MTVTIETIESPFGDSWMLTAIRDKYTKTLVRQFFSYADAQAFATEMFKRPMEIAYSSMFKTKGL